MINNSSATLAISALADPTRRALFEQLARTPQVVGELAATTAVSRSAVSQHLRTLREAGLVVERKIGRQVRYEVDGDTLDQAVRYLQTLAETAASHAPASGQSDRATAAAARTPIEHKEDAIDRAMLHWSHWSLNFDPRVVATIARMRLVSDLLEERYREVAGRFGLVTGEAIILGTLRRVDGPLGVTPGELARVSVIAPPSLAKHLRTLERKHLIRREDHPADRRSHRVRLTRKGLDVAETVTREQLSRQYGALFSLPDQDRKVLDDAYRSMMACLQEK